MAGRLEQEGFPTLLRLLLAVVGFPRLGFRALMRVAPKFRDGRHREWVPSLCCGDRLVDSRKNWDVWDVRLFRLPSQCQQHVFLSC